MLSNLIKKENSFSRKASDRNFSFNAVTERIVRNFTALLKLRIIKTFTKLRAKAAEKFNLKSWTIWPYERGRSGWNATIKYHKIFRFHFEKFLLLMHDIYEIIMFSYTNPHTDCIRIRSNRDNMNFSFVFAFLKVLSTWLDYTLFGFFFSERGGRVCRN